MHAGQNNAPLIIRLQDLFYRCKFSELLAFLNAYEMQTGSLDSELTLLKANALWEMHRVNDAMAALNGVARNEGELDENYLYAAARVAYLDDRIDEARQIFNEILDKTQNGRHRFKALLGIANTYYTEGMLKKLPNFIAALQKFEPLERLDERISLTIFLGNYHYAVGDAPNLARDYFKKALSLAAANTWTYFVTRSLFGLAMHLEKQCVHNEMMWTLEMLRAFVDESEQHFQSFLVNKRFGNHFSINTPMEFDPANKRIMVKNNWLPFHDRPLLFEFLLLLHDKGAFVGKPVIATHLWPQEDYKPRVHDPRIFDIAKRARVMIEDYESHPVVLLSGRMGYKLASV